MHTTPGTVRHEMAVAGVSSRPNNSRRPRGNRAKVTDKRLVDLYVRRGHNLTETASIFWVSTEYLRKRLHEAGLNKRLGSFTPHVPWEPEELRDRLPTSTRRVSP
jgi:hypothetical protein